MKYYKWTAEIDELTCEDCKAMDGHILPEDKLNQSLSLHGKDKGHPIECRCVYTEVEMKYPNKWNRFWNRIYAYIHAFFWLACPNCGRMFGGHEVGNLGIQTGPGCGKLCCKWCDDDKELERKWKDGYLAPFYLTREDEICLTQSK